MNYEAGLCAALEPFVGERVYPLRRPSDDVLPAITYQVISDPRNYTHQGDTGEVMVRFQLRLIAETYDELVTLRNSIVAALSGTKGNVYGGSPGIYMSGWFFEDGHDEDYPELSEVASSVRSKRMDVIVHCKSVT